MEDTGIEIPRFFQGRARRRGWIMTYAGVRSYMLVGVQLACIGVILISGPWVARHAVFFTLELSGILLGTWAILTMKLKNVNAFPEVRPGSRLVTGGPYRWIRHPMYTALLLIMLALVGESFSYWRGLCWLLLSADLVAKLFREETLLQEVFDDYQAYRSRTWRLVPWIF